MDRQKLILDRKKFEATQSKDQIKELEKELENEENDPNFDKSKKKYISYIDYVLDLDKRKRTILFDIREATGDGNYTNPLTWSLPEIHEYLELKKAQIEKLKALKGNGK
jgi:hypothetical protein